MKPIDLLRMSMSNLKRRRLRTFLTVLGVVIGTASIVVMLSLGLGLKKSSLEQIENAGGLNTITVYPNEEQTSAGQDNKIKRLDDKAVESISRLSHIKAISPVLQVTVLAKFGKYEAYLTINGMNQEALQSMNLKAGKGRLPSGKESLELFFGNQIQNNFYNPKGNGESPSIDFMKDTIFYIFDTEAYEQFRNPTQGEGDNIKPSGPPKKYLLSASGVLEGGSEDYSNHSYMIYADLDMLEKQVKRIFKKKAIPGQPTNKNGKPYKEIYYNSIYIRVDRMEAIEELQKAIREMGYNAESNMEWLKQTQNQMKTIQMVLGGIGAVSLFVAAIGIANTMMMSIYERTKEIGILKVLGCDLRDIGKMFLLEAGFIGFAGGLSGLVLSYSLSAVINFIAKNSSYQGISFIPLWLAFLALAFSVLVGMAAGFFPAHRAMKLSPLAALKNE